MRRAALWLVAAVVVSSACGSPSDRDTTISVVASTTTWGSVAAAVGGQHAQVRSIIDNPAEDPHSYDASPADAAAIADAQLVVYNGGGYDAFVDSVLDQHADIPRVDAFTVGGHQAGSNPHVFYDLDTVSGAADAIAERLASVDPTHAGDYRANAQRFTADIQTVAGEERAIATAHPGTAAIATEDVVEYLETATGLTDRTPPGYYRAVDADADPSPADIAAVMDLISSHGVQLVLFNPQTDTAVTHRIVDAANSAGLPVVEVSETLPPGMDFVTWQRQTVERLSSALKQVDGHTP